MSTIPLTEFEKEGRNTSKEITRVKSAYQKVIDIITLQPDFADTIIKVFNYVMKEHPHVFIEAYEAVTDKEKPCNQLYDLYLITWEQKNKIQTIKKVRELTNWELAPAKNAVEGAYPINPICLIKNIIEKAADDIIKQFAEVGAKVRKVKAGEKPNG